MPMLFILGCEMWAMNGANKLEIQACLEQMKIFCGTRIIDVYNEAMCKAAEQQSS